MYKDVISTLKLLGSKFFNEVQGSSKTMGKKSYDINFVDENESVFYSQDFDEDQAFEWMAAEGDEDALVMSQFEDLIIDCIQNDSEAAACLNAYTEARQKLILKAKSRGFWGKGGKDRGKGKSKGFKGPKGFQSNRPSLAQRIAESTCRICNQKGHWKWECPNKDRARSSSTNPSNSSGPQAFAGVTSVETIGPETTEWDILTMMEPPEEATAFVAQECNRPNIGDAFVRNNVHKIYPSNSEIKGTGNGLKRIIRKAVHRIHDVPDVSRRKTEGALTEHPVSDKPLSCVDSSEAIRSSEVAQVFFATQGTFGIVDLGASLSVIGKTQFQELCKNLPHQVIQSMKETPCAVNFRFGNDSIVQGRRAVFIPLGMHWLKIIVVPSNTPFLIANNVFRQFGAQIDTANDTIWFRRLDCTVPIVLSDRKLYMLDVAELISRVNAKTSEAETVNSVLHDNHDRRSDRTDEIKSNGDCKDNKDDKQLINIPKETKGKEVGVKVDNPIILKPETSSKPRSPKLIAISDPPSTSSPCHVKQQQPDSNGPTRPAGRPVSSTDRQDIVQQRRTGVREGPTHDTGRVEHGVHQLRENLCGSTFPNNDGRHPVCNLVCEQLQEQPPTLPRQVHPLHPTVCGRAGEESTSCQDQGMPKGQREVCPNPDSGLLCREGTESTDTSFLQRGRRSRSNGSSAKWKLGNRGATSPIVHPECRDAGDAGKAAPDGRDDATSSPPPEPASSPESGKVDPPITTDLDPNCANGWSDVVNFVSQCPSRELDERGFIDNGEFIYLTKGNNWVATEMWRFMASKGLNHNHPCPLKAKSDLIEIYRSQDSELTKQAIRMGSRATRHGLREGGLTTSEGRHRLYEKLFTELPMHAWMSPKCRAWCRWNVFNMNRNPKTAVRVMKARKEDLVHLLLCDAIFQFQRWRQCHAHLEQPVGSEMLLQAELQDILEQSLVARCDMCIAGQLSNPETGERIQKGTQIITSSPLMQSMLNKLRCDGSHSHHQIEGSIKVNNGPRVNLSQFTELYTRVFAHKVVRCMVCSRKVQEKPYTEDSVLTIRQNTDEVDPETTSKRRKLCTKQPPTPAYRELEQQNQLKQIVQEALPEAPRVGKRVIQSGKIVQLIQEMYPDYNIKCVELCKGADRLRVPPPGTQSSSAGYRLTIGLNRNTLEYFCEPWEEWSKMSRRQLIRHSPPARLLITAFAHKKELQVPESTVPTLTEPTSELPEPPSKKLRTEDSVTEYKVREIEKGKAIDSDISNRCQEHGPLFRSLLPQEREALMRIHKNLGHPELRIFRNTLISQGWPKETVKGIEDMHCPACHEVQQPKLSRPSHLSEPKQFNEVVMIDEVIWTSKQRKSILFLPHR